MNEPIAGIDLGTTNSLIGVVEAGFPILLADEQGSRLTPSAVYFPKDGTAPVIGSAALRRRATDPGRTIVSVKALMGRRRGDVDIHPAFPIACNAQGEIQIEVDGKLHSPVAISALIIGRLKEIAEARLERPIHRAVITVPAYFNDAQRQATKQAGEMAGFTVERILNEPTAAALAYGLQRLGEAAKIAVFDLGGGTFDLSILEMREGVFQVLATHGDTQLGGDDFDRALVAWLAAQAFPEGESPPPEAAARLLDAALAAKHQLSSAEQTDISLPFLRGTEHFQATLSRSEFENIIRPIADRTRQPCRQALSDAKMLPADLDQILLVGGSTRIPLVRRIAAEIFGQEPNTSSHPDEAVALGAVIQGGILNGSMQQMTLLDVTPLSLGIETFGGLMNVILPRNTTIPCKAGEMFTNAVDQQPSMLIRILQGEREMARDNWMLGELQIDFPPVPRGSARVGVQFSIDADGILHVLARDTKTQQDVVLEIRHAAIQVDDARVEEMISASIENAFDDIHERQLTEAKLKARELLAAVQTALPLAVEFLSKAENETITQAAQAVTSALEKASLPELKQANHTLDQATESLAAILVEKAMDDAMRRQGLVD